MDLKSPIQKKNNLLETATEFVIKNKWTLLIASGVVLVAILSGVLFQSASSSNQLKASREYDSIVNNINYVQYMTNSVDSEKALQEQMNRLESLIQTYPNTVGSVRARLLMSKALYSDASRLGKPELLDTAMAYYKSILDTPVADFYKALALIGLAQCSDRKQDYNGSFNYYNQIILKYGKQGFNPMSIVGMARAKEMLGDATGAIAYYRQVIRDNPDSMWTRYAKGKIYSFKETVSGSTNRQQGTNANQTTSLPYIIQ